ncbi:MAG: KpsF/GutQ family sugar-phosphate isomerase [Candidatus Pacebacteria bacterium]|nr:KpsF/GutQ family sugar-phosphate isomerase [Candidatus Paceibacterota bacterium]MCF7856950.1 KpsF/GutQ family sugar-phosphate isomerase [Candidatus Paceibacterota bacterium]
MLERDLVEERIKQTIAAEVAAVSNLSEGIDDNFYRAVALIADRGGKILITGVGKSGYIAMKMVATLISLGHESVFLNPLDALHGDSGMVKDDDVLVVFSFSGGSPELVRIVEHLKKHFSIGVVTITGNCNSMLSKLSDEAITFSVEEEGCPLGLAPMASTTASLVIADSIAAALTSPDTFRQEHFAMFHPAGSLGLSLKKVKEIMRGGDELPKVSMYISFEEVLEAITSQRLAQIVGVVDEEGYLVGALGDGDIRKMLIKHGDLRGKQINIFMNQSPKTINEDDSLQVALQTMKEHKINNLFVTDSNNVYIGFIHLHDIVGDYATS